MRKQTVATSWLSLPPQTTLPSRASFLIHAPTTGPLEVKKGQTFCKVPSAIQFPKPHYLTVTLDQSYLCVFSVDGETVLGAMRWLLQLTQLWEGRLTEEEGVRTQT